MAALAVLSACSDDTVATAPRMLSSLTVTAPTATLERGQTVTSTVNGADQGGGSFPVGTVLWSTTNPAVATVSNTGVVRAVGAGSGLILATVGNITGQLAVTVTSAPAIVINEVESNQGVPGDWIELFNPTTSAVNLAQWRLTDDDTSRTFRFPEGTTIPAGGYLVVEESQFSFGLGQPDAVRLLSRYDVLVDSYAWTTHATTTYGRCPNGTGAFTTTFAPTKGAANDCRAPIPMVRINEVESNQGTPGDWIEFVNIGTTPADISGYVVKDDNEGRNARIPNGTILPPGGFFVIEEAQFGFGLGAADEARLFLPDGTTLVDRFAWTGHAITTYGRCPDGTGAFRTQFSATKGAPNDCRPLVAINEVESNQGVPGDWVELVNWGPDTADISNFVFKDDGDTRNARVPAGTRLAPGAFFVFEEAAFGFGLGANDAARLYLPDGITLVDGYTWMGHAPVTYGRCPDGTGAFVPNTTATKGAANDCGALPPPSFPIWPGAGEINTVGVGGRVFGGNMSGLAWEASVSGAPAVLWAARNGPGAIFRLVEQGGLWVADPANGWGAGKALRYPDGTGDVDAEGLAFAGGGSAAGMYIAAERNNAASGVSRNSVLRYDVSAAGTELVATHEWNLTTDLPVTGANAGLEAITWIPDTALVAQQFFDESRSAVYDPANYPGHGTGLFFVGLEANGTIYAFALNHTNNSFTRIATINSGFTGVMDLEYDIATRYLWAVCDDTCQGRHAVLEIESAAGATRGRYRAPRVFQRPSGMPNLNNEGFAFVSDASCTAGRKAVFWADDNETDGHALRRGLMPCGPIPAARTAGALGARR